MIRLATTVISVFLIMNLATFLAYGSLAAAVGLEPPQEGSPSEFLASVLVVKIGMALGFVLIFHFGDWAGRWRFYALVWWLMFAVIEAGQAIGPHYSILDAAGGILAEAIYFPASAFVAARLLGPISNLRR